MRTMPWVVVCLLVCCARQAHAANTDFTVQFDRCAEYVGIGLVPEGNARDLVPDRYELDLKDGKAQLVVRIASCQSVAVDGKNPRAARTAQIGIKLVGHDPNTQIENYLLWFVTDSGTLHGKLEAAGVHNGNDQQLALAFGPIAGTGSLTLDVSAPRFPAYPLLVSGTKPGDTAFSFAANWFADGRRGTLRMHTDFPVIRFGDASLEIQTEASSQLAALVGASSLVLDVMHYYNEWDSATLQATLSP